MADIQLSNQIPNVFVEGAFHAPNGYIHAGQMELEKFPDNAALKAAAEALGFARSNGESINKLRANPHEDHMPQQNDRAIRESCDSFQRSFNEKFDNAKAGLVRELAAVEAGIAEKAGLKPNMAIANLTVGTLQSLKSDGERMKAVTDLLEDGDHETLATLMAVPRFTTMLPRDFLAGLRERVFHKVDPMGVALRDHLKVVLARFDTAGTESVKMVNALRAGTEVGAWKTRGAEAAARAAARR